MRTIRINLGTNPPIAKECTSPWVDSKVEDAAKWLQGNPDSVDLDSNHVAILDARAADDQTVVLCKIGDEQLRGDMITMARHPARHSGTYLLGMDPGDWETQFEGLGGKGRYAKIDYGDGDEER